MSKRTRIEKPSSKSLINQALADEYAEVLRLREMVAELEKKRSEEPSADRFPQ